MTSDRAMTDELIRQEALATVSKTKWLGLWAAGLLFAARNGNWLLSRKSNGASTLLLTGVWVEIALGLDAGRRARPQLFGSAAAQRKSLRSDTDLHEGAEP